VLSRENRIYFRNLILLGTLTTLVLMVFGVVYINYQHNVKNREVHRAEVASTAQKALRLNLEVNTNLLSALLDTLESNEDLKKSYLSKNRTALIAAVRPLFQKLRLEHDVSQLYFITPEREVFLRMHQTEKFGDVLESSASIDAQRMGKEVSGFELGVNGSYNLRVILPWYDNQGALLGYLKMAMDVDKSLIRLQEFAGLNLFMFVEKKFLRKAEWEQHIKSLGVNAHWDQFPDYALVAKTPSIDVNLISNANYKPTQKLSRFEVREFDRAIELSELNLKDFTGSVVGRIMLVSDLTEDRLQEEKFVRTVAIMLFMFGLINFGIAKFVIDRLYARLDKTELERDGFKIKSHIDSLTGLMHQEGFYNALTRDLQACRVSGDCLSVLMIDIDYFKNINDTYGHPVGDDVLKSIAVLLSDCIRSQDTAARYGGEEFGIILNRMPIEASLSIAERIRESVESSSFQSHGNIINLTLSIGVASYPRDAHTPHDLVIIADRALYQAKNQGRNRVVQAHVATASDT
jgi:diguanylate cyclase (GGDEF)-like protein